MWLYFFTVQFGSQSRGIYKPANQKAEKVLARKRPYDTKSHAYVVFKSFPTTKSVDLISKQMRGSSISSRKKKTTAVTNSKWKVTNALFDDAEV